MKDWIREARSWLTIAAVLGGLVVLVGEWRDFRRQTKQEPRVAVNVPQFERYRPDPLDARITAFRPDSKAAKKIRQDFGVEVKTDVADSGADLLAHKVVPIDCGGRSMEILVTLPEGEDRVEVATLLEPEELVDIGAYFEVGGMYGVGADRETRATVWAAVEPARFGRFHLRGEVGADLVGPEVDAYAMVGVVWRSR